MLELEFVILGTVLAGKTAPTKRSWLNCATIVAPTESFAESLRK
jgi:hypothetical protein